MADNNESYLVAFTLDFETGGLDSQESPITQIALHATRLDTFERIGSFVKYIYPYAKKEIKALAKRKVLRNKYDFEATEMMNYEAKALEYSAITMDMLYNQGEEIEAVAQGVVDFIAAHTPKVSRGMKPFIIGQNIDFDKGFLMQLFERTNLVKEASKYLQGHVDFYGHWQPRVLDTIILGQLALCHRPEISSYKLEIMCENLGIELDDAHDADADVTATTNVAQVLAMRMRNTNGNAEDIELAKTEKSRKHFKI
jgi:DNA polymerase III epsilon subunit-like protein